MRIHSYMQIRFFILYRLYKILISTRQMLDKAAESIFSLDKPLLISYSKLLVCLINYYNRLLLTGKIMWVWSQTVCVLSETRGAKSVDNPFHRLATHNDSVISLACSPGIVNSRFTNKKTKQKQSFPSVFS